MKKRLISLLLTLVMLCSLMPVTAFAQILECSHCGNHILFFKDVDEDTYICGCGVYRYHEECWAETHCIECGTCRDNASWYCDVCHKCEDCFELSQHCAHCREHVLETCTYCHDAGFDICLNCLHPEYSLCPGCGVCLLSIVNSGDMFCDGFYGTSTHCLNCDGDWICSECGQCCYDFQDGFCLACDMCLRCAEAAGQHCSECMECFTDNSATKCDAADISICEACCTEAGNHCTACSEHTEEWCVGGPGTVCAACHEDDVCQECGGCPWCEDREFCSECGRCTECCLDASAAAGCECGTCIESSDFDEENHMCQQCGVNFSCAGEDFCGDCELCMECCIINSEEAECVCGICIVSGEWEDHLCENCDLPVCARGDFCEDCGLCMECCIEKSEAEGCCCGTCMESSDWNAPDHLCEGCEEVFFCNDAMCDWCQLCLSCCEQNADEMGCAHGWCIADPAFDEHFCSECGTCKENCTCGRGCCSLSEPQCGCCSRCTGSTHCGCGCENCSCNAESLAGIGNILRQPIDARRRISGDNAYSKAGNQATFRVVVFTGGETLRYQWYCQKDGGAWTAVADLDWYDEDADETLSLISGATGNILRTYVPEDACCHSYQYKCVISNKNGKLLSESKPAALTGRHVYEWSYNAEDAEHPTESLYHYYRCIGCGYENREQKEEHIPGSWHFVRFATREQGAILNRRCNVCGLVYETMETEPLEEDHENHHSYYYIALEYRHKVPKSDRIVYRSAEHLLQCRCGLIGGREDHTWSDWTITAQATQYEEGSKWRQCIYCNFRQVETISKISHKHWVFQGGAEYDPEYVRSLDSHKVLCSDPACSTVMYEAPHEWILDVDSHYSAKPGTYPVRGDAGAKNDGPGASVSDHSVEVVLRCKVCGYLKPYSTNQRAAVSGKNASGTSERIGAGYIPVVAENTASLVRWVAPLSASGAYAKVTLSAKPPKGYRFVKWVNHSEECYPVKIEDIYSAKTSFTMTYDRSVERFHGRMANEKESFLHDFPTDILYLEAVCERIPNRIYLQKPSAYTGVYLSPHQFLLDDWSVFSGGTLPAGRRIIAEYSDFSETRSDLTDSDLEYYAYNEYANTPLYQAQLTLYDYNGGPISMSSTGAPCSLYVMTCGSNTITGMYGIEGCPNGGEVIIAGSDRSGKTGTLRIVMTNPGSEKAAGIQSSGQYSNAPNSVRLQENAAVTIRVNNSDSNCKAYGIYSRSFVEVLDSSRLSIDCDCSAYVSGNKSPVCGIYAVREVHFDTDRSISIDVSDVPAGTKATAISAKTILCAEDFGSLRIIYPAESGMNKGGCSVQPQYRTDRYIAGSYLNKTDNTVYYEIYPGWQASMSYADCPEGLTISVESGWRKVDHQELQDVMSGALPEDFETLYTANGIDWMVYSESKDFASSIQTRGGTWLVPVDGDFDFTVSAAEGYHIDPDNLHVYVDGEELECLGTDDGVNYRFWFCMPEKDAVITLSGGERTPAPFLTDPFPAAQTVLIGTAPRVSLVMDEAAVNTMRILSSDSELTDRNVYLQILNEETGSWELQGTSWAAAGNMGSSFTETRHVYDGESCRYRLAVKIAGQEYVSSEFRVIWTKDSSEVSRTKASSVIVHYEDAAGTDGLSELNAKTPCLVYSTQTERFYAWTQQNYENGKDSGYLLAAKLNASLGSITFYGDQLQGTLHGETVTANIGKQFHAVRTNKGFSGDLTVILRGDLTLSSSRDAIGWTDGVHYYDSLGAISNPYGNIRITGDSGNIIRKLGIEIGLEEQAYATNWAGERYYGEYAGVYAAGDITAIACELDISGYTLPNRDGSTYSSTGSNLGTAHRYGLWAGGSIHLDFAAKLHVDFPENDSAYSVAGKSAQGNAVGLKAGQDIRLSETSECSIRVWNNPIPDAGTIPGKGNVFPVSEPYGLYADGSLSVAGSAALTVEALGESEYGVCAMDGVEINTESPVRITVDRDGEPSYAFRTEKSVRLVNCSELLLRYAEENGMNTGYEWTSTPDLGGAVCFAGAFGDTADTIGYSTEKFFRYYADRSNTGELSTECYCPGFGYTVSVTGESAYDAVITVTPAGSPVSFTFTDGESAVCRVGDSVRVWCPDQRIDGCPLTGWSSEQMDCSGWNTNEIEFVMAPGSVVLEVVYDYSSCIPTQPRFVRNSDEQAGYIAWSVKTPGGSGHIVSAYLQYPVKDFVTGAVSWETIYDYDLKSADQIWSGEPEFTEVESGGNCVAASGRKHINIGALNLVGRSIEAGEYRIEFSIYQNGCWAHAVTNPFLVKWDGLYVDYTDEETRYNANANVPAGAVGTVAEIDFSQFVHGGSGNYWFVGSMNNLDHTGYSYSLDEDTGLLRVLRDSPKAATGRNSSGYRPNYVEVEDRETGEKALIYFEVGTFTEDPGLVRYDTYVGGIQATSANRNDVLGDGSVRYVPAGGGKSAVLMLNHANISEAAVGRQGAEEAFLWGGILTYEDLEIRVEGENSINLPLSKSETALEYESSMREYAIGGCITADKADLHLTGTGTLSVRGTTGLFTGGDVWLQGCTLDVRTESGMYLNGRNGFVYESGTCYSYCTDEDAIWGAGDPLYGAPVISASANPYELWILDMDENGDVVSYAPASPEELRRFSDNHDYYYPKAVLITDQGLTAAVSGGVVRCTTTGLRGGQGRLMAAQYKNGQMIAVQQKDSAIDLSTAHTISFIFPPEDGAEYKVFLIRADGSVEPISPAWSGTEQ